MIKFYAAIFFTFFLVLSVVNLVCFVPNFDTKQLTNPYFLGERALATKEFAKAVIFETGITLEKTPTENIYATIDKASALYGIDKLSITTLLKLDNEYRINRNGGLGILGLTVEQFNSTPYATEQVDNSYLNPFCATAQIYAAAYLIKNMVDSGNTIDEALANIILAGSNAEDLELKANSIYQEYLHAKKSYI